MIDAVVYAGQHAYRRSDDVAVVPLALFGDCSARDRPRRGSGGTSSEEDLARAFRFRARRDPSHNTASAVCASDREEAAVVAVMGRGVAHCGYNHLRQLRFRNATDGYAERLSSQADQARLASRMM
jgi:hypothetical protein